jgi:hypothetical protein
MGAMQQWISASLAAVFSAGMLLSAHLFTEYRSSRQMPITISQAFTGPL